MKIRHTADYRAKRAEEYPPIAELADAVYWDARGDRSKLDAYLAKCDAIKQKYPKA